MAQRAVHVASFPLLLLGLALVQGCTFVRFVLGSVCLADQGACSFAQPALDFACALTEPVVLARPADGEVVGNAGGDRGVKPVWQFDWNDVPGAAAYAFKCTGPGDVGILIERDDLSSSEFSYVPDEPVADDHLAGWRWQVRARGHDGVWGEWQYGTFAVGASNVAPGVPASAS